MFEGYYASLLVTGVGVKCGLLQAPLNGYMNSTNSTAVGVKSTFGCNKGYTLVGSSERSCLENGQWDRVPAQCWRAGLVGAQGRVTCPDPGTPDNGFRLIQGHFVPGSLVWLGCNQGYHRHGDRTLECLDDGAWSSTPPLCIGRYYYDKIQVIKEKIESMFHTSIPPSLRYGHSFKFVYLVFDSLSTVGTDNFRHVISLAKAITTKASLFARIHVLGIASLGRNASIVLHPRESTSLDVALERLDQLPYSYGTASSSTFNINREFRIVTPNNEPEIRRAPYPLFSIIHGSARHRRHHRFRETAPFYYLRAQMFSIGVRGDSEYGSVWLATGSSSSTQMFMLRDYEDMKLLADAITKGDFNITHNTIANTKSDEEV